MEMKQHCESLDLSTGQSRGNITRKPFNINVTGKIIQIQPSEMKVNPNQDSLSWGRSINVDNAQD